MPPLMAFYLGRAMLGARPSEIGSISRALKKVFAESEFAPIQTQPEKMGGRYPWARTFRFAIPALRLKSGVRFELANVVSKNCVTWRVYFFFGSSKQIHEIPLDGALLKSIKNRLPKKLERAILLEDAGLSKSLEGVSAAHLQRLWSHQGPGTLRPFQLLDKLNDSARRIEAILRKDVAYSQAMVARALRTAFGKQMETLVGVQKLARNAPKIVSGFLVGSCTNVRVPAHLGSENTLGSSRSSRA
jgi:DNA (cytosine-5)-methyltransferase 1